MKKLIFIITFISIAFTERSFAQKTVRYDLFVNDTTVNYTGKKTKAIAINGQIPAPTLIFTEGDTAEIYVHNVLNVETSIHWHGLILPNQYDGVPYLTTAPIKPGQTHLYKFPIVQNGTYWYHSHSELQEQSGLYGAFIIHKKKEEPLKEYTVLLSDWTNYKPSQVDRNLHNATDWYAIKKGSTQSYFDAIKQGYIKTKIISEWKRMLPMDVSDVYYNAFLTNGKISQSLSELKAGDKIKLRIINGSSSTYFWLQFAGSKLSVVASDGSEVVPVDVDRMLIGVSETYDVIVTVPEDMSYELRATAEDRSGSTSLWLGSGMQMSAPILPKLKYFAGMKMMNSMMKMNGEMNAMGMHMSNQQMDMNTVMYPEITGEQKKRVKNKKENLSKKEMDMPGMNMENNSKEKIVTLNYGMLYSTVKTNLPNAPVQTFHFNLTGNMNRYVWSIDNKTLSEANKIIIKKGENIRVIIYNGTMMRHPMHLHGHFFRVLNGHGDYSPLKNVLDIMPMETDTIEFAATESGDWFFHCHILYHMMSGMGRIFSYENSAPNPEIPHPYKALMKVYMDDKKIHSMAQIGLESNGSDGELMLTNTRYRFQTEWRIGLNDKAGYESESHIGRYLGKMQFAFPYIGWDYRYRKINSEEKNLFDQTDTKDNRQVFCAGFQYKLPLLLIADVRIDMAGKFRMQLMRDDIAITSRLKFGFMVNTDKEYLLRLRYVVTKYLALSTHYDSDMKFGAGITFIY